MVSTMPRTGINAFANLTDPRVEGRCRHRLRDVVLIVLAGVVAGADDFLVMADFAVARQDWLRDRLELSLTAGVPSHDTLNRVMALIKPAELDECLARFVAHATRQIPGPAIAPIAIDGKALRGSRKRGVDNVVRMAGVVNAWATSRGLTLAQVRVDEKSNEITAMPKLLDLLDVSGALVTIDSIGCQTEIAAKIVKLGGDYLLQVTGNQPHLHQDIQSVFGMQRAMNFAGLDRCEVWEPSRVPGRQEYRDCVVLDDAAVLQLGIRNGSDWKDLRSVIVVRGVREVEGVWSEETRYFISNRRACAAEFLRSVRSHWRIENSCHWVLDVAFREDDYRLREGHGPENLSTIRRPALTMLKGVTAKCGIKNRRLKAAWDTAFLERIFQEFPAI